MSVDKAKSAAARTRVCVQLGIAWASTRRFAKRMGKFQRDLLLLSDEQLQALRRQHDELCRYRSSAVQYRSIHYNGQTKALCEWAVLSNVTVAVLLARCRRYGYEEGVSRSMEGRVRRTRRGGYGAVGRDAAKDLRRLVPEAEKRLGYHRTTIGNMAKYVDLTLLQFLRRPTAFQAEVLKSYEVARDQRIAERLHGKQRELITHKGVTLTLAAWAARLELKPKNLASRFRTFEREFGYTRDQTLELSLAGLVYAGSTARTRYARYFKENRDGNERAVAGSSTASGEAEP